MPADWILALQLGMTGFGMVFVILTVLYLALWITGRLGARLIPAQARAGDKVNKANTQVEQKRVTVPNG